VRDVHLPFAPLFWGIPKVERGFLKQKQLEGKTVHRSSSMAKTWLELEGQPQKCEEDWGCVGWSQESDKRKLIENQRD